MGQQLSFKRKHLGVVPIHGPWPSISGGKKGSRLRLCFWVVDDVPEKKVLNGFVKQMSSSKCSFTCICGIFWPLNPSTTAVYVRSAFYPSLRFTLSLHFTHSLHFTPGPQSAVRSPQSVFYTDRIANVIRHP